ncbi:3'-5' exoribonuclease HELZ2-like isoform X4 [Acropora muricata]|uniref:3'-5' exoribonuclease HELZ2-like isoform X4 n=1 Tax=Acropora muricata TaxID=159855 RepID=UPI0034E4DE2F
MAEGGEGFRPSWEDSEELRNLMHLCLMDKDVKAIEDSSEAIKFAAQGKGTNNLMAKSLFIKIKAMERLGEFVEVLPFAVLCKHLRPKCEKTLRTLTRVKEKINKMIREDERVANQILIRMVACGKEEMERGRFELALDHFSELLELLYFKIVPGVLLMRAECLLKLGRHKEAKESCEKVLVYESNNKIARKLMQQISEKLKNLDGTKEEKAVCTVGKKKADDRKEYKSTKTSSSQEDTPGPEDSQDDEATQGLKIKVKEKSESAAEERKKVVPSASETADKIKVKSKESKGKKMKPKGEKQKAECASSSGETSQPKIKIPSHDDVSGEESSQSTSSVARDTSISLENANKGTSGKTAASISSPTSTVKALDVDEDDSSGGFTVVVYSHRRRSSRSAKANSGKQPLPPYNQVERQPLQETRGSSETSLALQGVAQSNLKQGISHPADNEKKTVENHSLICKPDSAARPTSNATSMRATAVPTQTSGQKLTMIDSKSSQKTPYQGLPNVDSDQESCSNALPKGVVVACDHFLRGSSPQASKVCAACKQPGNPSRLRYAVWNRVYWQEIRPFPAFMVPPKANLDLCRHFNPYKRCANESCSFPHGQVESAMWTMERKFVLPTPRQIFEAEQSRRVQSISTEVLSNAKQMTDTKEKGSVAYPSMSLSSLNEFPALGGLTSESTAPKIPNSSARITPMEVTSGQSIIPPSKIITAENTGKTPISASSTKPLVLPQSRNETSLESVTPVPSTAWVQSSDPSGKSTASLLFSAPPSEKNSLLPPRTNTEQSPQSFNNYSKLPENVVVVCMHFLNKRSKAKACKGCENRSKLMYAVWNENEKKWQEIRPYPKTVEANVAFTVCRNFSIHGSCLQTQCSFAHGTEEQLMWTLEREGVLPTPRETLTGLPEKTTENPILPTTHLRYRPSPPGVNNGVYKLCKSYYTRERCRFGRGCIFAHGREELNEWKQEYQRKEREKHIMERQDKEEMLISEILKGSAENFVSYLEGVDVSCDPPDFAVKLQDSKTYQWTFTLKFKTEDSGYLQHVLLLHRHHDVYQLSEISVGSYQGNKGCDSYNLCFSAKLTGYFYKARQVMSSGMMRVSLTVSFRSSLFGIFDQSVVFDFGKKPYLVKKLTADVHSQSWSLDPVISHNVQDATFWDERSVQVVRFVDQTDEALQRLHLSRKYSLPVGLQIPTENLTRSNYKEIMHALLYVEERFMKDEISRYTLSQTQLHSQWNIFDEMTGMKCALENELFGILHLQGEDALRPDDAAGRLLYRNVNSVWLQLSQSVSNKVYEAPVEKVESECVVLRMSSKACSDLNLFDTCDVFVNAQFQLNRWPICEMHEAVDRLTPGQLERLVFPGQRTLTASVVNEVTIRWQWLLDQRLNDHQKAVIKRIASRECNAWPLVVFGPFGTGKTFTLNQAVRLLVQLDKSHRILLCTHSNRAADIHVELLHKYLKEQNGTPASTPLRIYQPMRRLETASQIARNYCLIKNGAFLLPTRENILERRVIITTLSTSKVLLNLQVFHGFFTHILIDEAAQALEPETLTPLVFAGPETKVVFTGDHMQMSPEVYSPYARQLGLEKSLAERLFDLYEQEEESTKQSNVLFLTENYRSNEEILKFPSFHFYGDELVASGHNSHPAHPKYGPLLFFSARGKEEKEQDNSYVNLSEVDEVVKRVKEIANNWPTEWGPRKLSDIAVLSSYRYQVQAIRNSLRKDRAFKDVKVDTIHNVQGEEFRVLFISTVRTFHTCKPQEDQVRSSGDDRQLYWEFLSDPKLLNTAVTRARCLVAVVGDPVSLCTVGKCRLIWRNFIDRCYQMRGLYGTTVDQLKKEVNAAIASIQLNPEAKTFVPKCLPVSEPELHTIATEGTNIVTDQEATEERTEPENSISKTKDFHSNDLQKGENEVDFEENEVRKSILCNAAAKKQDQGGQEEKEEQDGQEGIIDLTATGNLDIEDLQDIFVDDETLHPREIDEIIKAFIEECKRTRQLQDETASMFQDSEFPALEASRSKAVRSHTAEKIQFSSYNKTEDISDLCPQVVIVNGRVEVRLTNLGLYKAPSERAQKIIASAKEQEFFDPSVLKNLLEKEPDRYVRCNLRLSPENPQMGYAVVEDTKTPDIQIRGRVRQAFDKDKIVLELLNRDKKSGSNPNENESNVQGKIFGVLEHIISPRERQFVCTPDYENLVVMFPINKSATKMVNLGDKRCAGLPIYRMGQNDRPTKVKIMKREQVLSGKYLFLVKFLRWGPEYPYPLGMVVKALPRGDDFKSSMEIVYAERGIRRVFKEDTMKYVKQTFPPDWSIPKKEYSDRPKVGEAFTIDPPNSLDLDDAITVEKPTSSTFRIGIHIADVSFFVKPSSPLDEEAFLRCTSYYPGEEHENIPMLPRELSEGYCSLLPEKDRLAVSVFVTLDEEGRITKGPNVKRTIVTSCCRLTYLEAQEIINGNKESTTTVPVKTAENIRQLSSLAQKRRRLRLEDRAFDHWQNNESEECFEAHELVEEMMLLANEEIAKMLSAKCPYLAPLRIQLPPKDHKLAEWVEMHSKYATLSLQYAEIFQNRSDTSSSLDLLHREVPALKMQRWVWSAIRQAVVSRDFPKIYQLICNEANHPQLAAMQSRFRRIQSESKFVCEVDQPEENIHHYSLGMRSYTQFTSPMRRYMDIVVHRLLLDGTVAEDDIAKVCRRSNYVRDNSRKFERDCKRIRMAFKLQERCQETRVFIESIDHNSVSLHISKPEDDNLAGKQKQLVLSHLNLVSLEPKNDHDLLVHWKFRKYTAPDANTYFNELIEANDSGDSAVVHIPPDDWRRILNAVRSNDENTLVVIIKQLESLLKSTSTLGEVDKRPESAVSAKSFEPYKHPHFGESHSHFSSEPNDHFYEKKLLLKKYDFFAVQLCPHMVRGMLVPEIQLFKVNPHLNICVEHRKYPRESFAHTARHQASREHYETIDEYINAWRPVLAMEAATEAVKESDGFVIERVKTVWKNIKDGTRCLISLPKSYCKDRQLEFHPGDLVCARVPYSDTKFLSSSEPSQKNKNYSSYCNQPQLVSDFWVGHCIVNWATRLDKVKEEQKKKIDITLDLHQKSSQIPDGLTNGDEHRCTIELLHRTLPQRRMYAALCTELENSSKLVHAICKGEEPKEENFGMELPLKVSLEQHGFKSLNQFQEAAVKEALSKPFTLIQGPPGTGKTVTGVHIAYWFTERNERLAPFKNREKRAGENEREENGPKAPAQVIYCGPSNKAVDVVTEYLMKIPRLKILRVYSDLVEQKEFPIPNALKPARATRSDADLKITSEKVRSVSLHHVIRSSVCPHAQDLRECEEGFAEARKRSEKIGEAEVDKYRKLIGKAERWALEQSGVQIVLCTCVTAGSRRIVTSCDNVQQCIVDECGMCMEPESLVPITCSGARQIVLIGDHKQLQPVVQDHVAKSLGLNVSMFERHSKRAKMLRLQYRMHEGICEFPSHAFYDGKLQTAEVVKLRERSPIPFWPAMIIQGKDIPIVFCHVEGQEESTRIASAESNEESKWNQKEVLKTVHVAKCIVNQYGKHVRKSNVAVLTPYRQQLNEISKRLKGAYEEILVTTITKSQGSEWDYVIISLVRSLKEEEIDPEPTKTWLQKHLGFLADEHQMNVGLTRARRGLCIIGNKHLLSKDKMWAELLQHYEKYHCLVDEKWPWQ